MKVWLIGMYGVVATTTAVGITAFRKGLIDGTGLVTELPEFKGIERYADIKNNVEFGGHEIRNLNMNLRDAAMEHWNMNRHYSKEILDAIGDELARYSAKRGTAINCGTGMNEFKNMNPLEKEGYTLREITDIIIDDLKKFKDEDTVVINVASTEPVAPYKNEYHDTIEGFERMIDEDRKEYITASMIYAYAALKLGIPYGNFTPSAGSSIPALKELAKKNRVPHAGNDGKTGETYMKTTLAPAFKYRNLRILGWMSYNILGDYDGMVLSHKDNKESKIISKDSTLTKITGYEPYSITDIQFFPSLYDNKTAFDFIHYRGFLGTKMKFYFIWDGIDAILAAPLVVDIARLLLFAKKKGKYGVIREMAFFFKSPMESDNMNTHLQYEELVRWFRESERQ